MKNLITDCEISLSLVNDEEIHEINKQFRNIDRPTDVLSFPQLTFEEGEEADVNENGEIVLGDIIISVDKAKEQAGEFGHSMKREMAFLGRTQHAAPYGYDHMEKDEEEEMFQQTEGNTAERRNTQRVGIL